MNLFPEIEAFLTGGDADDAVLQFAARLATRNGSESLSILGVPEESPLDRKGESFESRVRTTLARYGSADLAQSATVRSHAEVSLDEMLKVARDDSPDLLILGRRLPSSQLKRSSVCRRLVRKAPCSVLLVTRYAVPSFDRILVPVDFSAHAAMALHAALEIAEDAGNAEGTVLCQHVAPIPYGYRYSGDSKEEFARKQEEATEEDFRHFVADEQIPVSRALWRYTVAEDGPAAVIDLALAERANLVVVGSRGRTAAAALLLGSTTEKLVERCAAPVLVVKKKGETASFLRALLGE